MQAYISFGKYQVELRLNRYPFVVGKWRLVPPWGGGINLWRQTPPEAIIAVIEEHRRAVADDPSNTMAWLMLANCLRMEGSRSEARSLYEKLALSGNPHNAKTARDLLDTTPDRDWRDTSPNQSFGCVWSWGFSPLRFRRR